MNQYSWRICTKQLKLKPWCIASTIGFCGGGGAEAPLAPPPTPLSTPLYNTCKQEILTKFMVSPSVPATKEELWLSKTDSVDTTWVLYHLCSNQQRINNMC